MSLQAKVKSMIPDSSSPRKKTLSGKRSAWITPCGRLVRPDAALEIIELARDEVAQARLHVVGATSGEIEQRPPARRPTAHWRATSQNSAPARCIFASPSPTPAQCAAFGLPRPDAFEKGDDRRRPARTARRAPRRFLFFTGCGQVMPCAARCVISARKNGRSSFATRFSYSVRMKEPRVVCSRKLEFSTPSAMPL